MLLIVTGSALTVERNFSYYLLATSINNLKFSSGTINVGGNVIAGRKSIFAPGQIVFNGTADQTYASVNSGQFPGITINKASGNVTPAAGTTDITTGAFSLSQGNFTAPTGTFTIYYGITFANGTTFLHNNGTVKFLGTAFTQTATLGADMNLNNFTVGAGASCCGYTSVLTVAGAGTFIVNGDFAMNQFDTGAYNVKPALNGNTIQVKGNLTFSTNAKGGTAGILLTGTGTQTITQDAGALIPTGTFTINKPSGSVELASDIHARRLPQGPDLLSITTELAPITLCLSEIVTPHSVSRIPELGIYRRPLPPQASHSTTSRP
jgi:hypothetical protein